eukprot:CAMPEP_0195608614 /NCGR_PEP_ID=MMETSP0815-20121206/8834_1 /TAXON_ID=97485 /ORGANISM="Prymnesium parvum, Strain Texoma1" /LENGTH=109 /DNA_ID=CAMNT_0040748477 /DNA_START=47 /DNA_END=376 /DNA_ORIENTATION=-
MAVPAVQITTPQSLLNGTYEPRASSDIPQAFRTFCAMMAWEAEHMWVSWTTDHGVWYELANGAFLYWNATTLQWWIVGPSGDACLSCRLHALLRRPYECMSDLLGMRRA